jgi:ribose transport system permease protein
MVGNRELSPSAHEKPAGGGQNAEFAPKRSGATVVSRGRSIVSKMAGFDELGVILALVVLALAVGLPYHDFLKSANLLSVFQSAAFVAIVAYGMVFLLAQGEIDLSVGGSYAVSLLITGKLMGSGMNPWLGLIVAPIIGALLSALNGVVANLFSIPVIIVSIGTLTMYGGVATVVTDGQALSNLPVTNSFFTKLGGNLAGVPAAVWVAVLVGVVLTLVFTRTRFGVHVRAVGSNRDAARLSGISPERVRILALLLTGALCGLAGVLTLAYAQNADASIGNGYELEVIAAAIIGGTAVTGGRGTVPGALLGALVVAVITSGLVFYAVNPNWNDVVSGAVVVIAVSADGLVRVRRARRRRNRPESIR